MAFVVIPWKLNVSCFASDLRSEFTSLTTPNRGWILDPVSEIAPVCGTIDVTGTKTGRPPSLASENFGFVSRFRSRALVCATPCANEPSTENVYLSANRRLKPSEPLHARGAAKSLLNTLTFRRVFANCVVPLHVAGTVDGSA